MCLYTIYTRSLYVLTVTEVVVVFYLRKTYTSFVYKAQVATWYPSQAQTQINTTNCLLPVKENCTFLRVRRRCILVRVRVYTTHAS